MKTAKFDIKAFADMREDPDTGDILFTARKTDGTEVTGRIARSCASLFGVGIISVLEISEQGAPEYGKAQVPCITQSRPVQTDEGEPGIEVRLGEKIPIVLRIRPGSEEGLRQAITKVEELRTLAKDSRGKH